MKSWMRLISVPVQQSMPKSMKKGCVVDSDNDGITDSVDKGHDTLAGVTFDENGCAKMMTIRGDMPLF